ncbi:MAG: hypothetical protein JWP87_6027 [Labilithrix sp.]|nr:hypothetical protein [Labilithrix sp.]
MSWIPPVSYAGVTSPHKGRTSLSSAGPTPSAKRQRFVNVFTMVVVPDVVMNKDVLVAENFVGVEVVPCSHARDHLVGVLAETLRQVLASRLK